MNYIFSYHQYLTYIPSMGSDFCMLHTYYLCFHATNFNSLFLSPMFGLYNVEYSLVKELL